MPRFILIELVDDLPHQSSGLQDLAPVLETLLSTFGVSACVSALSEDELESRFTHSSEGHSDTPASQDCLD